MPKTKEKTLDTAVVVRDDATNETLTFALAVTELSSHEIRKCLENVQRRSQPIEERQQETFPEQACEIAAEKPSLMETSPSGAPVMTGKGVQTVRKHIEQQFEKVRNAGATSLIPKTDKKLAPETGHTPLMEAIEIPVPRPRRLLSEIAVVRQKSGEPTAFRRGRFPSQRFSAFQAATRSYGRETGCKRPIQFRRTAFTNGNFPSKFIGAAQESAMVRSAECRGMIHPLKQDNHRGGVPMSPSRRRRWT